MMRESPMLIDAQESQLVLVDYQTRLMPAIHEGPLVLVETRKDLSQVKLPFEA